MVQIIPTVLAISEEQYRKDIMRFAAVDPLKGGWVHLDFMDNKFVPNQGINPIVTSKYEVPFKKEAHLMVQHPKQWLDKLVQSGFERVSFHLESDDDIDECLSLIKDQGLEVGLVLNHETPLENLEPFISKIDTVLLMSVVPGFQGQPFIEGTLNKIKDFKLRQWQVRVGVDGAVKNTNIKQLVDAGVDYVIVGSYLLKGDIDENLKSLWEALRQGFDGELSRTAQGKPNE